MIHAKLSWENWFCIHSHSAIPGTFHFLQRMKISQFSTCFRFLGVSLNHSVWTALCNFICSSVVKGERGNIQLVVEICSYLPWVCTFGAVSEFQDIFIKHVKNSIYHWDFCKKLLKFSQKLQILISFSPKRAKMCRPAHLYAFWRLPCRPMY